MRKRTETLMLLDEDEGLFGEILRRLSSEPERAYEIVAGMGLSWGALLMWCERDRGRMVRFLDILKVRAHVMGEENVRIADEATPETVGVARLRVDTRFKLMSKWNRQLYGEEQDGVKVPTVRVEIGGVRLRGGGDVVDAEVVVEEKVPGIGVSEGNSENISETQGVESEPI